MDTPNVREQILVVEDEATLRTMLKLQLEREGYRVRLAEDGEEALARIAEERPDLVLLDVDDAEAGRLRGVPPAASRDSRPRTSRSSCSPREAEVARTRSGACAAAPTTTSPSRTSTGELLAARAQHARVEPAAARGEPAHRAAGQHLDPRRGAQPAARRERVRLRDAPVDIDNFKAFNDYYGYARATRRSSCSPRSWSRSPREPRAARAGFRRPHRRRRLRAGHDAGVLRRDRQRDPQGVRREGPQALYRDRSRAGVHRDTRPSGEPAAVPAS